MTTKIDQFLSYINSLIKEHFNSGDFTELEKMSIRVCIYDIFQKYYDPEEIYYELLDFLEKNEKLASLVTKVEMYYLTSSN